MQFIARNTKKYLIDLVQECPAVGVYGHRQSGKTTLVQKTFPSYRYVPVEDVDIREFARTDSRKFLATYRNESGAPYR